MGCGESTQAGAVPTWGSVGHRWTCTCPSSLHDQRRHFHLPLPTSSHPIPTQQGCLEHQAAPLHLPQGRGWGGVVLRPPQMAGRLVGMSCGWQGLRPSLCAGLAAVGLCLPVPLLRQWEQGRAGELHVGHGEARTRHGARCHQPGTRGSEHVPRQAAAGKEAGRQHPLRQLRSTLAALSLEPGAEADRIITVAIWAYQLVPLPFAFCIMDRL